MVERWLKCKIFKGMFTDELAVQYSPPGAAATAVTSVFVPRSLVEGPIDGDGKVRVFYFRDGETDWAVLPTDNQMIIPVREADLAAS